MHYVVSFEGRCMGFCPSEEKAQELVQVFGEGSSFEQLEGAFPSDAQSAARAYESTLRARGQVVTLRAAEPEETTVELSYEELLEMKDALGLEGLPEDPWAENGAITGIRGLVSESGFITTRQVG